MSKYNWTDEQQKMAVHYAILVIQHQCRIPKERMENIKYDDEGFPEEDDLNMAFVFISDMVDLYTEELSLDHLAIFASVALHDSVDYFSSSFSRAFSDQEINAMCHDIARVMNEERKKNMKAVLEVSGCSNFREFYGLVKNVSTLNQKGFLGSIENRVKSACQIHAEEEVLILKTKFRRLVAGKTRLQRGIERRKKPIEKNEYSLKYRAKVKKFLQRFSFDYHKYEKVSKEECLRISDKLFHAFFGLNRVQFQMYYYTGWVYGKKVSVPGMYFFFIKKFRLSFSEAKKLYAEMFSAVQNLNEPSLSLMVEHLKRFVK